MNRHQRTRDHRRRPGRRHGFVLLMSLILIALVGILLAGLARRSLQLATETREATADLQRRWGTVFLSKALLTDPRRLIARRLEAPDASGSRLPLGESFQLGELTFRVVLDDENRKLNINRLRAAGGTRQALETLRQFAGTDVRVELRPLHASALGVREFDSWGHVVRFAPSDDALHQFKQLEGLSRGVTCWGNAKVNVRTARDDVLRRIGTLAVGPITANRLVALRDDNPRLALEQLLAELAVAGRKAALLKGWLCEESECYSLWILASARRTSVDLFVCENARSDSPTIKHFQW